MTIPKEINGIKRTVGRGFEGEWLDACKFLLFTKMHICHYYYSTAMRFIYDEPYPVLDDL